MPEYAGYKGIFDRSFGQPKSRNPRFANLEYAPISAEGFFEQAVEVEVAATHLNMRVYYTPPPAADGTVMVCHHGAGYSALSFACFAKEVQRISEQKCGILALDARRHGELVVFPVMCVDIMFIFT